MVAADRMGVLAEVRMEASAGARTPVRAGARMEARAGLTEDIAEAKLQSNSGRTPSYPGGVSFCGWSFCPKVIDSS
jgi:hypothetical protein